MSWALFQRKKTVLSYHHSYNNPSFRPLVICAALTLLVFSVLTLQTQTPIYGFARIELYRMHI